MTYLLISSLNKNNNNNIDNFLFESIVLKIAHYTKNILVINNVKYSKIVL